jgi:hypothetical protein
MLLQRILGTGSHLKYGGSQGKLAKAAAAASAANQSVAGKICKVYFFAYRTVPSVADPGCLSRIRIFPSRIRIFLIPDPNFSHPGSASKNLSILTQKIVSKLSEI